MTDRIIEIRNHPNNAISERTVIRGYRRQQSDGNYVTTEREIQRQQFDMFGNVIFQEDNDGG